MNLQQLEYIVAVDTHRNFAKAAQSCFITQPTLSSMVKKFEGELGQVLFDRSKMPVVPTAIGTEVVAHARVVLKELAHLRAMARHRRERVNTRLRIGMIPTLAPYLIPLFLPRMVKRHPEIRLSIAELTTEDIKEQLARGTLDVGVLATPLEVPGLREEPLFRERFLVYAAKGEHITNKRHVLPKDIDPDRLWLLEEGHCLRSQVMNLCELRERSAHDSGLHYISGSIGSLLRIVDIHGGLTIVPELAGLEMDRTRRARLREFKDPAPVREISTVTYRHSIQREALDVLREEITAAVRDLLPPTTRRSRVLRIDHP